MFFPYLFQVSDASSEKFFSAATVKGKDFSFSPSLLNVSVKVLVLQHLADIVEGFKDSQFVLYFRDATIK